MAWTWRCRPARHAAVRPTVGTARHPVAAGTHRRRSARQQPRSTRWRRTHPDRRRDSEDPHRGRGVARRGAGPAFAAGRCPAGWPDHAHRRLSAACPARLARAGPNYGDFEGVGELRGALRDHLELTQKSPGAAALELHGDVRQALTKEPAWSTTVAGSRTDLKPFVPDLAGKTADCPDHAQRRAGPLEGRGAKSRPPCRNSAPPPCALPRPATTRQ